MSRFQDLRSAAAPAAKTLLMKGGVYAALRRIRPSRQLAILRYHAICDPHAGYADPTICVSPRRFDQHVRYLAENYTVLSLPEAVVALRGARPMPPNAVAITFDDGYADNLDAARILHRHGVTATFYLTAGCLAGDAPFWPAELRHLIAALEGRKVTLRSSAEPVHVSVTSDAERRSAIAHLTRLFKSRPIRIRERLRAELRAAAGHPQLPSVMLTWDQVREMAHLGMTIGAHTVTHPNLPSAGLADARTEITAAKTRIERELDAAVTMFSYPNGGAERYYTPELQNIVRHAGYAAATTSRNGFAGPASDPYALERVQVAEKLDDLIFALEVERFAMKPARKARKT